MSLPTYNKSKRKSNTFEQLPKGAYVIKIMGAKEDTWPSGDKVVRIAFDIAEGKYMGFYQVRHRRGQVHGLLSGTVRPQHQRRQAVAL